MAENKPTPNQKLRHERERRAWSQQDVADKVGTTPLNVGRWERGVTTPGPHFRQKLCELFERSASQLGLVHEQVDEELPDISPSQHVPAAIWHVPYNRNPFFTGRDELLTQLHTTFQAAHSPVALSQPQAMSGLGGIGKTQTAVEYAYRFRDDYAAVLWARADSPDLLTSDFLLIAALLSLPQRNEQDQNVIVKAVIQWLDTHEGWLLILDNADHLEIVPAFLPSAGKGHVLLTTRAHSTGTIAQLIELEKLKPDESLLFLLRRIKYLKSHAGLESVPQTLRQQAQALVEALDGLPLALDQAGAYIEETGCSLSDYLKFYKTRRHRLLRMRGSNATGHPEPVATTWSLSFEKVEQSHAAAAELLHLCAFLHPDEIPEAMITEGASALGPALQSVAEDELELNEAIGALRKYSLVKRDPEKKVLNIHRLVQAVMKDGMAKETFHLWAERAMLVVNTAFPVVGHGDWQQCERLLSHALLVTQHIETHHISGAKAARLLYECGLYLREHARYAEAEHLFLRSVSIWEQAARSEQMDVAYPLYGLALLYREQGKFEQSEALHKRAILIWEQTHNTGHPDFTYPLNGLAMLYRQQGKYEQAEPLYQRAIHIIEQAYDFEHPDLAHSLNGLALLYREQGKYEQSEPVYQRTLRIWEQAHGPEHPWVAFALEGLATLYCEQGKYEQAEPLYQRTILIWEKTHGPEHPWIGVPLDGLATLYREQGKLEQAERLYQRAIFSWEKAHGPEHPDLASPLNGLANLYREQGKYEQAEPLYRRAIHIRKECLGPEHPKTAQVLHDFALLQQAQGKNDEAGS